MNNKRVLLLSDSHDLFLKIEMIINMLDDFQIDYSKDEEIFKMFEENHYNFILLDDSSEFYRKFIDLVLENKPSQKLITFSDNLDCAIPCTNCLDEHRIVRLLKPFDFKQLYDYLITPSENFYCHNKHKLVECKTLEELFELIQLKDNYYFTKKAIKENKIIIESSLSSTMRYNEILKIKKLINEEYFQLNVLPSNTLEIVYLD